MSQRKLKFIARIYTILIGLSLPVMLALGLVAIITLAFGGSSYWYVLPLYACLWIAYIKVAKKVETFIENASKKNKTTFDELTRQSRLA